VEKSKVGLVPAGTLGAFIVRDLKTDVVFNLSGRISAKDRQLYWDNSEKLLGQLVTYKHFQQSGVREKPRLPIFKSFRSELDL